MTGYLIDTNVVSELSKESPNPSVIAFLRNETQIWLSTIVIHEIEFGIQLLPEGRRRESLFRMCTDVVSAYSDRVLSIDRSVAERAAVLRARSRKVGHIVDLGDALIAGTAMAHGLTLVTRNVRDFDGLGIDVHDPWQSK